MSSDDIILSVRDVAKGFRIYDAPIDRLKQSVTNRFRSMVGQPPRDYFREFWALQDVSFDVRRGETVGVIGRNGAGKSTLLQIICGTLMPTRGSLTVNGKISALLELGAGFNPEFTGRDNVMLSGAILGLDKETILSKFDDIAAFADIGQFIDQPVKTYSSGMYVRLAFAVASHVDPELLVVDEALAVGDSVFQAKCMNKIRRMMDNGLSLLFVSHDISAVKSLCHKAVLLEQGKMLSFDDTSNVANMYTAIVHERKAHDESQFEKSASIERLGDKAAEYLSVEVVDQYGRPKETFLHGEEIWIAAAVKINEPAQMIGLGVHIRDRTGADVAYLDNLLEGRYLKNVNKGEVYKLKWRVPCVFVRGRYDIATVVSRPGKDADPESDIAEDYVISDFVAVAGQFGVAGDWNIYGNLRLGALEEVQFLTQELTGENQQVESESARVLSDVSLETSPLMLHAGCGQNILPGWINIDAFGGPEVYRWDFAKGLPFPDGTADLLFSEHFIEHLTKEEGLQFLREVFRVLKPGGMIRMSTPSLDYLVKCYLDGRVDEWADLGWVVGSTADLMNGSMRNWGHKYMYNASALASVLGQAGFGEVRQVAWRESEYEQLRNLECRAFHDELIFEAKKL